MSRTLTIPDQLYSRLASEARSEGLSSVEEWLQKFTAALPRNDQQQVSSVSTPDKAEPPPAVIGHALDQFFGDWSEAEAKKFLGEVAVFGQIDESLWK